MFHSLLQWDILQNIILNTIFVSIPEELFLVMFTLILLGEFDYWKEPECKKLINKFDYIRILVPTAIPALISNILRFQGNESGNYQIITPLLMYILIIFTNDIFSDASVFKWMLKALIFFMFGFLCIGISEFIYVPLILYSTELTMSEINQSILLNFVLSIPARVIQYYILIYLVIKKRALLKCNPIKIILNSTFLSGYSLTIIIFNLLFFGFMNYAIITEKLLVNYSHMFQILTVVGVIIFPILNIFSILIITYYIGTRITKKKNKVDRKIDNLLNNIEIYTNNSNYANINWKLNEFSMDIKDIASSLKCEDDKRRDVF